MEKIRILIVDDNYRFIKSAINFISLNDEMEVIGGAISGGIALDMIQEYKPDLILLDLALPNENGIEILKWIKSSPKNPKVVIVSIQDDYFYKNLSLEAGADGYISKSDFGEKIIPLIHCLFN
jgi:two-component system, NarL family, response regulator DegU